MALLAGRENYMDRNMAAVMPWLLVGHFGMSAALFLLLPYSKFVHGLYRTLALIAR
jgi:citrate/tricarballylate utilization protein